ncbi:MAG: hypothetical protein GWM87_00760, partial [Xanthomonadales bacterium]|nr:hypothetical protein [Xanthomonadales bacterium]NIX11631.1 hypothetical protein [Xanthomonadales bacterium]
VNALRDTIGDELADDLINAEQVTEADIAAQRARVAQLKERIADLDTPEAVQLKTLADML